MSKKSLIKRAIVALVLITGLFLLLKYRRIHNKWEEEIYLLNGEKIVLAFDSSHRAFYGPPHNEFGGGGNRVDFKFNLNGNVIQYGSEFVPIVIQKQKGNIYLILYRVIGFGNPLKLLIYNNGIKEIAASEFPKNIVIQNRTFDYHSSLKKTIYGEPIIISTLNPENKYFRKSLTAQLWYFFETGKGKVEKWGNEIKKEFLIYYKIKYINPK
jgi:hypothetical protein